MQSDRQDRAGQNVVTVEIPPNIASFDVVMAVVEELSRNYDAVVTEADVSVTGGVITLLVPPPDDRASISESSLGE